MKKKQNEDNKIFEKESTHFFDCNNHDLITSFPRISFPHPHKETTQVTDTNQETSKETNVNTVGEPPSGPPQDSNSNQVDPTESAGAYQTPSTPVTNTRYKDKIITRSKIKKHHTLHQLTYLCLSTLKKNYFTPNPHNHQPAPQ